VRPNTSERASRSLGRVSVSPLRARAAVTAVFFVNGAVFSSWYARLPAIQERLDLSTGTLGLALLGAPLGLPVAQPLVGALIALFAARGLLPAGADARPGSARLPRPSPRLDALGLVAFCALLAEGAVFVLEVKSSVHAPTVHAPTLEAHVARPAWDHGAMPLNHAALTVGDRERSAASGPASR